MAKTKKRSVKRSVKNEKHPTATYPRAKLKLPKGVDPQRKRAAPRAKKNPVAVGKGQQALLRLAQRAGGQWVMLTDVTHRQVPLSFAQLMRSAKGLAGKGCVEYADLGPGAGYAIRMAASRNPDAVAPAAQPAAQPLAPPAPTSVAASVPSSPPAAMPATKNPGSKYTFTWQGSKYTVAVKYGVSYYRRGSGGWLSVREALADKRTKPALRAHLKAAVHALEEGRNKAAGKEAAKIAKLVAKVAARGRAKPFAKAPTKRSPSLTRKKKAVAKAIRAEIKKAAKGRGTRNTGDALLAQAKQLTAQFDTFGGGFDALVALGDAARAMIAQLDARVAAGPSVQHASARKELRAAWLEATDRQRAAGESAADAEDHLRKQHAVARKAAKKNPAKVAKPKKAPTKKDFARIVKLFKQYVTVFAKKYPNVAYVGLKVDPTIHDSARHMAMTGIPVGGTVPTVAIAPELAFEPVTVQRGIIIHELAHAVRAFKYLPSPKGYDANERATDKLAETVTGLKIYYDSRGVEVAGKGARGTAPRPAGLR